MSILPRLIVSTALLTLPAFAQTIDPTLAVRIDAIPAIDNHAHPLLAAPQYDTDRNFDALPVDNMEPDTEAFELRPEFPALHDAWLALFHFDAQAPLTPEALKQLDAARQQVRREQGANYPAYVLDKSNIATMLANRTSMGNGIQPPRFRWVPYADDLLFPLDNSLLSTATPDRAQFFPLEDALLKQATQQAGLKSLPTTLDGYLKQVVTATLEKQKSSGAIAEKFEIAYLRSFGFDDVPQAEAAAIYARWLHHPHPDTAQYKRLQDFLFRYIASECGRIGLAVHIHAAAGGGGYFAIAGANPLLLEPLFNDKKLRHTNFVLLHGGWPFVHEIGALLQKPNVYLDLSEQCLMVGPRTISTWLREWIELYPEKVLYATDAYPYTTSMGWEESAYIANRNIRQSLGYALTGMIQDNQITQTRAEELARMVLQSNAKSLYHF